MEIIRRQQAAMLLQFVQTLQHSAATLPKSFAGHSLSSFMKKNNRHQKSCWKLKTTHHLQFIQRVTDVGRPSCQTEFTYIKFDKLHFFKSPPSCPQSTAIRLIRKRCCSGISLPAAMFHLLEQSICTPVHLKSGICGTLFSPEEPIHCIKGIKAVVLKHVTNLCLEGILCL